jgi:hypothetical protein
METALLNLFRPLAVVATLLLASCSTLPAASTPAGTLERLEIISRDEAFSGVSFGDIGQYELIVAIAHMRVDPLHPANRTIVDLDKAKVEDGAVRYKVDVVIVRPRELVKSSRVMVVDIPNRGNRFGHFMLNDVRSPAALLDTRDGAGIGHTLRRGHTMVWVGWQSDIKLAGNGQHVGVSFPVATDKGQAITGISAEEEVYNDNKPTGIINLTYPAVTTDKAQAALTVRPTATAAPTPLAAWHYVNDKQVELTRANGFDAGAIYEFRYMARDPVVAGLGMAALRDVTSFLKVPSAGNPLSDIRHDVVLAFGFSQSGRYLRDFIWYGFNDDTRGGKVFDGAMPLVAGSRKTFANDRFAQPGRYSGQHVDHIKPGDQFPFSYGVTTDPVSKQTDGIFARCQLSRTCPKLMHIDSNVEFWQARASLVVTNGVDQDIALPPDVRAYLVSSVQHVPAREPVVGFCKYQNNPAQQAPMLRALLEKMVTWTRDGSAPPATRYPSLASGTLAAPVRGEVGFPDLAAVGVGFPGVINALTVVDHSKQPARPDLSKRYRALVPITDADGHDVAGVRLPDIAVPLATHSGWNLRRPYFAEDQLCDLNGLYVPLPANAKAGDPRLPLVQRYPSRIEYVKAVAASARDLRDQGFLLDEDVKRYIERAQSDKRLPW